MIVCLVMCSQPTANYRISSKFKNIVKNYTNLTVLIVNQIAQSPARESYLYSALQKIITNFGSSL